MADEDPYPYLSPGGQIHPLILNAIRDRFVNAARGMAAGAEQSMQPFVNMAKMPGQTFQAGYAGTPPTTEQMVPWAADVAMSGAGMSAPFALGGSAGVFGGRLAQTANKRGLVQAQEKAWGGEPPEQIWRQTGWFQGTDGKWRYEISDLPSEIKALPKQQDILSALERKPAPSLPLRDVLHHPQLYEAYPEIGDMPIRTMSNEGSVLAAFNPPYPPKGWKTSIDVTPGIDRSALLHEVQHAVQGIENFAIGGNPSAQSLRPGQPAYEFRKDQLEKYGILGKVPREVASRVLGMPEGQLIPEPMYDAMVRVARGGKLPRDLQGEFNRMAQLDAYKRLAGEVEARNVQTRQMMLPSEQREMFPRRTEDYPEREQIVRTVADQRREIARILRKLEARNASR